MEARARLRIRLLGAASLSGRRMECGNCSTTSTADVRGYPLYVTAAAILARAVSVGLFLVWCYWRQMHCEQLISCM